MSNLLGQRAVVVGAGIGGLSMAGVLAKHFEQVEIFERDRPEAAAVSRPGTPQDRHPHGLLAGGLRALGEIFPGFESDLARAGAVPVRVSQDMQYERPDIGAMPKRDFGISLLCASRPLIELVLRRRTGAIANVTLRPQCRVTGIMPAKGNAVRGIRFDPGSGRSETLQADLVVDASGRGALTSTLFDAIGWERPEETEVGVDIRYATVVVPIPPNAPPEWKIVLTQPDPCAVPWHAVLVPMEDSRWIIVIADHGAGAPIETWDDFLEASRLLITPTIFNALRHAGPPHGIRHYRLLASTWKHFERLPRLPRGVLPVADSLCRFNPIHGQGMSSAANYARVIFRWHIRNAVRFQKRDQHRGLGVPAGFYHFAFEAGSPAALAEKRDELRTKGVEVTDIVNHGWAQSIYFKDPNGLSLEYCCTVRNLTEDDATMQERFTIPRAALELNNTLSAIVPAAKSAGGTGRA